MTGESLAVLALWGIIGMVGGYVNRCKGKPFLQGFIWALFGPLGWYGIRKTKSIGNTTEEQLEARKKAETGVKWAFLILLCFVFILHYLIRLIVSSGKSNAASGVFPTSSVHVVASALAPTNTYAPAITKDPPTPSSVNRAISPTRTPTCVDWSTVSLDYVGSYLCVAGTVYSVADDGVAWYVKFKSDYTSFYFLSYAWHYPDVKAGLYVRGIGTIKRIGNAPVIVLDEGREGDFQIRR